MEFQGNAGFLSSMPPKLEDAGLEDCALPIEGIQSMIQDYKEFIARKCEELRIHEEEAFRIAAEKAKAAADTLKVNMQSKAEDIGGCISNPTPPSGDLKDTPIGTAGTTPGDSCVDVHTGGLLEDGKDAVVDPIGDAKEDKLLGGIDLEAKLGEDGCLKGDPLEPVGIPDASAVADNDGEEEPKGPSLTEVCL
ncbi:hypothetical protein M758_2G018600 [Ceratodon purpureus]|nr:hypothetical protein M758_2G018600 [Ceratodon purpureus]